MDRRLWRPLTALLCVSGAVFAVAQGQFLAPDAPAGTVAAIAPGNVDRGKAVFATTCAGCHGDLGAGGSVGPKLAGAGLTAAIVQARIDGGAGVMPAGLVHGAREADVITYVVGLGGAK
jgi:mono/diheme cytochrome c family protein